MLYWLIYYFHFNPPYSFVNVMLLCLFYQVSKSPICLINIKFKCTNLYYYTYYLFIYIAYLPRLLFYLLKKQTQLLTLYNCLLCSYHQNILFFVNFSCKIFLCLLFFINILFHAFVLFELYCCLLCWKLNKCFQT